MSDWCEYIAEYFLAKKDVDLVDEVEELLRLLTVMADRGRVLWTRGGDGGHHFVITSSGVYVKQLGMIVGGWVGVGGGRLHVTVFIMIKGAGIKAIDIHVECDNGECLIEYNNEVLGDVNLSMKVKENELKRKLMKVVE